MATFVLVHGGGHGGWAWHKVAPLLRAAGHAVHTPTLTGLGERAHLAHPGIDLDLHVQDIVNVLLYEDLRGVVLVGHSYAGLVITGVADRAADRIAHLVYLDAANPRHGEAGVDLLGEAARARVLACAEQGWTAPEATEAVVRNWGVPDGSELTWVMARLRPQPVRTLLQPLRFRAAVVGALPRTYVYCTERGPLGMRPPHSVDRALSEPGWRYRELPHGHAALMTAPDEVAALLREAACA